MKPLDNQSSEKFKEDPMIKVDDQSMMESMEEQLWAMEAGVEPKQQGLMGTKLELPPLRKGTGALGIKAKYNPDRPRTMIGDRSKTPSMAPTPTRELDRLDTPEPGQQLVSIYGYTTIKNKISTDVVIKECNKNIELHDKSK